jgi:hypothetical protein
MGLVTCRYSQIMKERSLEQRRSLRIKLHHTEDQKRQLYRAPNVRLGHAILSSAEFDRHPGASLVHTNKALLRPWDCEIALWVQDDLTILGRNTLVDCWHASAIFRAPIVEMNEKAAGRPIQDQGLPAASWTGEGTAGQKGCWRGVVCRSVTVKRKKGGKVPKKNQFSEALFGQAKR